MPDADEAPDVRSPPSEPLRPAKMLAQLAAQGVSEDTVVALNIYADQVWHEGAERWAVCFPHVAHGQHIGNWYRFGDGKWKAVFHDRALPIYLPYNFSSLENNDTVVIAANPMEVAAIHDAGHTSVMTGPALFNEKEFARGSRLFPDRRDFAAMVDDVYERLAQMKKFVLALPSTGVGENKAKGLTEIFGALQCWRVNWPTETPNAVDTAKAGGGDAVRAAIEGAHGVPLQGIREFKPGELQAYRAAPRREQFSVGVKALDSFLRWRTGQVVLVIGDAASGKSTFISWIAVELAKKYGWRWAVCSPEHEHQDTGSMYAEQWAREPYKDYGLNLTAMSNERLAQAERWVGDHFFEIAQENEDDLMTTDMLLHSMRLCKLRYGVKAGIIDPYNQLEHEIGGQREDQYVGTWMRRIRLFARHNDMLIIIAVHPPKMHRNKDGKRPVPTIFDSAGSAHFANQCTIGLTVHRPDFKEPNTEIIIQKVKPKDQGQAGVVNLRWDKETGGFKGASEPLYSARNDLDG